MSKPLKKQERLLKLARESIKEEFGKKIDLSKYDFNEERGVFVTLKKNNKLRGCIGFLSPMPLNKAVYKASKKAAFSDPRFLPLKKEELKKVKIEISILTLPKECSKEDFENGKDGLICECEGKQGLLLPQVAEENSFSKKQFLECLCKKAGLSKDALREENFKLKKFRCHVFSE